jgi:hypothetical protein
MNCIFSWLMVAVAVSAVLGNTALLVGTMTTTASCTGLPSLSMTDTTRLPAKAPLHSADKPHSAVKSRFFFMMVFGVRPEGRLILV